MARRMSSVSGWLVLMAAVAFFPMLLQAQDNSMSNDKGGHMSTSKETATGCLQRGRSPMAIP